VHRTINRPRQRCDAPNGRASFARKKTQLVVASGEQQAKPRKQLTNQPEPSTDIGASKRRIKRRIQGGLHEVHQDARLAVVAAMALTAFIGVSSASATGSTAHCKVSTTVCPAASLYSAGTD
jgi:hypothetical protein